MSTQGSSLPTLGSQSHSITSPHITSASSLCPFRLRYLRFLFYTRYSLTLLILFNIVILSFLYDMCKKEHWGAVGAYLTEVFLFNTCVLNCNCHSKLCPCHCMESECRSFNIFGNLWVIRKFKVGRIIRNPLMESQPLKRNFNWFCVKEVLVCSTEITSFSDMTGK